MSVVNMPSMLKVFCAVIFFVVAIQCATVHRIERHVPSASNQGSISSAKPPKPNCTKSVPCGWAVYTPFTRKVDYFMRNTYCLCPEETICMRTEDDLTISAYVYHCLINATSTSGAPSTSSVPST